jgi:hypothetical protein
MGDVPFSREDVECNAAAGLSMLGLTWPRPIPVSERLPGFDDEVIWYSPSQPGWEAGVLTVHTLDGKRWVRPNAHFDIVPLDEFTHWLPLPPAPCQP